MSLVAVGDHITLISFARLEGIRQVLSCVLALRFGHAGGLHSS